MVVVVMVVVVRHIDNEHVVSWAFKWMTTKLKPISIIKIMARRDTKATTTVAMVTATDQQ